MKSVIKFEISQSSKIINFLEVCITLNQQTLSTTVFSKPTETPIYLNPKFCHPNHAIKNIPKSQFLRLHKICSNTSDYTRKNNEYLNIFMKQDYYGSELNMIRKIPWGTPHKKSKNQNEKTIMYTTWHSALKQFSKTLCEKDRQHIENGIHP